MERLIWLFQFLLYFMQYHQVSCSSSISSFSTCTHHLCPHDQRFALLQLKHTFTLNSSSDASKWCEEFDLASPKMLSWNESCTDCCSWEGVTCDGLTGHVIGLDLSCSQLNGSIHPNSSLFQLSHLHHLNLAFNHFNYSHIPSAFAHFPNLTHLNLSGSSFSGSIPSEIRHLSKLVSLDLSYGYSLRLEPPNFRMMLKNLTQLQELVIAEVYISSVVPMSLMNMSSLTYLDLTSTELHGKLPDSIFHLPNLQILSLEDNYDLTGNLSKVNWSSSSSLHQLYLGYSSFSGEIPSSICNVSSLFILHLSYNHLSGAIPQCLGNFSNILSVLDLGFNAFQGNIPMIFGKGNQLEILNLNGNQFEGPVPRSLTNCRHLQILDLGNNKINDTFPYWLGILPELRVLVLRSNKFHGPIDTSKPKLNFPKLRIVDLSHNKFTGHLPERYFKIFKAMRNKTMPNEKYLSVQSYYQDSISVTMKGFDIYLTRILTIFTAIDLSSNKFSGDIPNVIGRLNSLIVLNLSHNSLTGLIPSSLGDLTELESLDLSSNQLIGKIPNHLLSLTFLEVFNLSCNHLDGRIPQGKQFDTFGNDSYVGNLGLCGFPLSKECEDNQSQVQPGVLLQQEDDSNFVSGFTWEAVVMGYACGMPLGLVIGFLMFLTGKPKLFVRIVEGKKHKKVKMLRQRGRRN